MAKLLPFITRLRNNLVRDPADLSPSETLKTIDRLGRAGNRTIKKSQDNFPSGSETEKLSDKSFLDHTDDLYSKLDTINDLIMLVDQSQLRKQKDTDDGDPKRVLENVKPVEEKESAAAKGNRFLGRIGQWLEDCFSKIGMVIRTLFAAALGICKAFLAKIMFIVKIVRWVVRIIQILRPVLRVMTAVAYAVLWLGLPGILHYLIGEERTDDFMLLMGQPNITRSGEAENITQVGLQNVERLFPGSRLRNGPEAMAQHEAEKAAQNELLKPFREESSNIERTTHEINRMGIGRNEPLVDEQASRLIARYTNRATNLKAELAELQSKGYEPGVTRVDPRIPVIMNLIDEYKDAIRNVQRIQQIPKSTFKTNKENVTTKAIGRHVTGAEKNQTLQQPETGSSEDLRNDVVPIQDNSSYPDPVSAEKVEELLNSDTDNTTIRGWFQKIYVVKEVGYRINEVIAEKSKAISAELTDRQKAFEVMLKGQAQKSGTPWWGSK